MSTTALIAEDEPLLALALQADLATAWPELQIVATVSDGHSAVRAALRLLPQVMFLDMRMPGLDGLEAAAQLAECWPLDKAPLPQLVFVTAYEEYAVQAFEAQVIDYVLKPVQPERLRRTVARLRQALTLSALPAASSIHSWGAYADTLEHTLAKWRQLLDAAGGIVGETVHRTRPLLRFLPVSNAAANTVFMVPIDEVLYFETADKYVRVLTKTEEHLIRTPLKQLLPQLDPGAFWQVHRSVVVRCAAIESVQRSEFGKLSLALRGRSERIVVSRLYAHMFHTM
ncbi:LytR/AlgR family response regulator transcription factor [Variovorax sp. RHLX14]|uniref:LytR/AlgR family response regulator transcription factor n=1 Tax=Variovorax sp. RHLX14 TaxID=1259731 RepID=UPI003F475140